MEITKENKNKKGLGRGLGSLLGGDGATGLADYSNNENLKTEKTQNNQSQRFEQQAASTASVPPNEFENKVWNISIDKLVPGVYQPRKNFEKESLTELANSIKENGIIQPITVRKRVSGGYEIIAGERRWRAAQIAGLHEVPAIIKQVSDRDALQLALIENIQRENLDPVEEADSYQRLIEEFSLSQQEVADKVGKERSTVANSLRLLLLPFELKEMLTQKMITVGHAKALLSIQDKPLQVMLAKKTIEKGFSVRALEQEIKNAVTAKNKSNANLSEVINLDIATKLANDLADQLQKALGTKVEINYKAGKGGVHIHFYSDDQLTQIFEKLKS